jgi:hypothetical protein
MFDSLYPNDKPTLIPPPWSSSRQANVRLRSPLSLLLKQGEGFGTNCSLWIEQMNADDKDVSFILKKLVPVSGMNQTIL